MNEHDEDQNTTTDAPQGTDAGIRAESTALSRPEEGAPEAESAVPRQLGVGRYVLAGFFAAGMAVAYVISRMLAGSWNKLADNVWVSQHVPVITRLAEDDRATYAMLVGGAIGLWLTIWAYRREDIRTWTNEVAAELSKVTWPTKKEVTNSTIVVLVASAFATAFLALLDRFWSFVTNLVYGS